MRSTSPHIAEDKEKLAEQWKRYRQDHTRKQLVAFFEENKSKAWFREKYQPGPEFEELRQRLKKKGREGKIESFISRLEKGDLDILNYDYACKSISLTSGVITRLTRVTIANCSGSNFNQEAGGSQVIDGSAGRP
jgi:hypothetical protein